LQVFIFPSEAKRKTADGNRPHGTSSKIEEEAFELVTSASLGLPPTLSKPTTSDRSSPQPHTTF